MENKKNKLKKNSLYFKENLEFWMIVLSGYFWL